MPKPTKKPCDSWTGSNFYQKSGVRYVPRSTSAPGTQLTTYFLSQCCNSSLPRSPSPSGFRSPSVPRSPSLPETPSVPRMPYKPHSIRHPNSYGPRIQKYDEYINIFDISDDSDKDISSCKKYPCRNPSLPRSPSAGLRRASMPCTPSVPKSPPVHRVLYSLGESNSYEKTTLGPTKAPNKPIIQGYHDTQTRGKDQLCNAQLNTKKSVPIKKISFVLPGCKKPLNSENMNWKDFHKLNVIYQFMDDLETNYPSICTTTVIGKSVEGRDLKILKVSNSNANNAAVWIDSGIHAREWIAPAVNTYIANHIIKNFDNLPESVRNKDWYFLPIVNPDGYHYSHSIDRMWRKNRALHNGIRSGVDLNRNFGVGWGRRGSSENPQNAFYRGPHPFSEPESSAMRDMLVNSGINFQVYITLHCYGQIIIFPYSFTSEMAPDYLRLLEGATTMSKAIYNTNGSTYKVGVSKDVMYSASGTSNDFAHGQAGIPYCYLIELRSKKYKFRLPKEQIEETGQEILNSVLALMEYIDSYPDQDRVEQNIDSLLENDSFIKSNHNIDSSVRKKHSNYKKSKYSQPKNLSNDIQGSFIRLTHYSGERDDSAGETNDTGSYDSLENVTLLKNEHRHTSKKETNPTRIDISTSTQYPSDYFDSESELDLENNMDWYKKVDEHLPDFFNNENESVLKKSTSEKETNPYKKINPHWPNFFECDKEFHRNKTNISEKETDPYKKENQYHPDSIDTRKESDLLRDIRYSSKQEAVSSKKVDQYVPGSAEIGTESDLKMDYPSEKEINQVKEINQHLSDSFNSEKESQLKNTSKGKKESFKKVIQHLPDFFDGEKESNLNKINASENETNTSETEINQVKEINEFLPDFLFAKSDLKQIGTLEKGRNLNNKINQHLSDSFNSEKESQLKEIYTSKGKEESSGKVIEVLPDFFDGEKQSNLNKANASKNETNTSETEINRKKKINECMPDLVFAKSDLNKIGTSEKRTNLNKTIKQHLSDSFNSEKESQLKKIYTSKGKKESSGKVIEFLPDSFDSEKESNLYKINVSESETNTSEKEINKKNTVNKYLPDFLFAKSDLKKIGTSEKRTNLKNKINLHLSDSFNSEKESQLKKIYTSKGKKESSRKFIKVLTDSFDSEKESNLYKINVSESETNTSEKEINKKNTINKYLPDFLFAKSDPKKIGTSEKRTNLKNKINLHLSDSFNSEKESQLKKIYTSKGKKESSRKFIKVLTDSFDSEKESNLNKINTAEKETNTSEKEYLNDSDDSLFFHSDSLIIKAESTKALSHATGCCVDSKPSETSFFADKEDSFEAWNSFYEQKSKFDKIRSNLLLKTGDTFVSTDMQCQNRNTSEEDQMRMVSNDDIFAGMIFFIIHFVKAANSPLHIWKEQRSAMDIMVRGNRTTQVAALLIERDIPYSIEVPDITVLLKKEQLNTTTLKKQSKPVTMDWTNYHTLDTIYAFLENLQAEYPYLCSVQVIGKSVEGRDLKMLKISNGQKENHAIWMDGAIHPREWISPAVVTYLADRIVRTFNELPESVSNKDWYILPVLNPDGYEYTHTHDRMWRKNRARYGECVGVDLNRNFSYGFAQKGEEGSSDDPGSVFYRGPRAFSEPETTAVKRVISDAPPTKFKAFLSFHSYGEAIIFPWGYTSDSCPDYVNLLEGGTAIAKAIFGASGHTYKVGSTKDLMYYAAGTSIDWSYAVPNIPYSYMIELRSKIHRFLLPKEEIITTATEIENGVWRLMAFIDQRCTGTQTCPCPK